MATGTGGFFIVVGFQPYGLLFWLLISEQKISREKKQCAFKSFINLAIYAFLNILLFY